MSDDQPLNREQRRAARFRPLAGQADPHAVGASPDAAAPDVAAGPVEDEDEDAGVGGGDADAHAQSGSGDVTRTTGAGAGGATESDERTKHDEGAHYGNQPNS